MTDEAELVLIERRGRVGWITLNRPKALNALNAQLVGQLGHAVGELDRDENVGCIVITGSSRAFAAGADIKEMAGLSARDMALRNPFREIEVVANARTPLVAAVAGYALGGGCELAMTCDLILAADTATFGLPELGLGVIPGLGGTQRLPRAIGPAKAAELILTGRSLSAEEAERAGLVARVVPAEELLALAMEVAETIAGRSLPVLYAAKEALRAAQESSLAEGLRFERQSFAALFSLDDQAEGMAAFTQKRKPHFTHR